MKWAVAETGDRKLQESIYVWHLSPKTAGKTDEDEQLYTVSFPDRLENVLLSSFISSTLWIY